MLDDGGMMSDTIVCPHPGEHCDSARFCAEPGCTYGLIMSGFFDGDRYYCFAHFNITSAEMEDDENNGNGDLYGTDWEPGDTCDECDTNCPCPDMTESRAKSNYPTQNPDPWDMEQVWSTEYRVVVPVYNSEWANAVYAVEAVSWVHARSRYYSNIYHPLFDGEGYWQVSGPAPVEKPEGFEGNGHREHWVGQHLFSEGLLLDIGLNMEYDTTNYRAKQEIRLSEEQMEEEEGED